MRTAEPGIYAIGDIVAGYPQLAHSGAMEGIVAVTHIAGKPVKPINKQRIPNATYCHPEIGSVGLTEAKAKRAGLRGEESASFRSPRTRAPASWVSTRASSRS